METSVEVQTLIGLKLSPEGKSYSAWRCPACGNRDHFVGHDSHGWGGPDVCDGTCGWSRGDVSNSAYCKCETHLTQNMWVLAGPEDMEPEVEYDVFEGGGFDAEIGTYTRIDCGRCGFVLWAENEDELET